MNENGHIAYGGFADVWEGTYGGLVGVKVLRIENSNIQKNPEKSLGGM